MKDRSENRQNRTSEESGYLDRIERSNARLEEQVQTALAVQVKQRNEIADLQAANLKFQLREIEWDEKTAQLNRKVSALQGENTKLRRRVGVLERQLLEAGVPVAPDEEVP